MSAATCAVCSTGMAKPGPGPGAPACFSSCPPRTTKPPPVASGRAGPRAAPGGALSWPVRRAWNQWKAPKQAGVEPSARPSTPLPAANAHAQVDGVCGGGDKAFRGGAASRDAGLESRRWRGGSTALSGATGLHSHTTSRRHVPTVRHDPHGRSCPSGSRKRFPGGREGASGGCATGASRRRGAWQRRQLHAPHALHHAGWHVHAKSARLVDMSPHRAWERRMDAHGGPQGHGGQALPQPHRTLAQYGPCNIQLGIPSLWEPTHGQSEIFR